MKNKIVTIILNFMIVVISALIIYILYKAFWLETNRKIYFLLHFLVIIPIFIFTIFIKFKSKRVQENYILTLGMLVFCIYIFEFFIYSQDIKKNQFQFNENIRAAKKLGIKFDDRKFDEVFLELKKEGKKPFPSIVRKSVNIDGQTVQTFSTISNRFILMCNEAGSWITFKSDRYGFNNPDKVWDDNINILILADSSGEGQCVNQNENFAGAIRNTTNKNALQAGGSGMGPIFEYGLYKEFINNQSVDNLVIFFLLNDLDNIKSEINNPILMKYLEDKNFTQNLISRKSEIDKVMEYEYFMSKKNEKNLLFKRFIKFFHARDYLKRIITKENETLFNTYNINDELLDYTIKIYKKIRSEFKGNLYIGYLPSAGSFMGTTDHKEKLKQIRIKIIKRFEENNFNVLNFYEKLKDEEINKILPFGDLVRAENHFTAYGHKIISNYIIKSLY